jgi:hypothetical protein
VLENLAGRRVNFFRSLQLLSTEASHRGSSSLGPL